MSKRSKDMDELTELQAEVDALEADDAADAAKAATDAKLQLLRDRKTWLELKRQHAAKRPKALWHESGLVVIVAAPKAVYDMWRKSQAVEGDARNDQTDAKIEASIAFAQTCIVYPERAEFRKRLEVYAGLVDHVIKAAVLHTEGRLAEMGK